MFLNHLKPGFDQTGDTQNHGTFFMVKMINGGGVFKTSDF
jgi:hypothetical protein